jgi:cytochrome c biogenesis protein CcmG/thiol:disulfide interchange protein DsbE
MRLNLFIFITLLALGFCLTRLSDLAPLQQSFKPAPAFSFTDLEGKIHHSSEFKGKTVILNFWASWCPPCVKEFPALIAMAKKHPDTVLLALSADIDDKAIENFLARQHLETAANIIVARDSENIAQKLFGTFQLPETFVIDHNWKIREKFIGADWQAVDMEAAISR